MDKNNLSVKKHDKIMLKTTYFLAYLQDLPKFKRCLGEISLTDVRLTLETLKLFILKKHVFLMIVFFF